jgi:hypothetical protein
MERGHAGGGEREPTLDAQRVPQDQIEEGRVRGEEQRVDDGCAPEERIGAEQPRRDSQEDGVAELVRGFETIVG